MIPWTLLSGVLHLVWETVQLPLYTIWAERDAEGLAAAKSSALDFRPYSSGSSSRSSPSSCFARSGSAALIWINPRHRTRPSLLPMDTSGPVAILAFDDGN